MTDQEQIAQIDAALEIVNSMWAAKQTENVGHIRGMLREMRSDIVNNEKTKRHDLDFAETMARVAQLTA